MVVPIRIMPPIMHSPPAPVTMKACIAFMTASGFSRSHPMSRNELIEVNSQKRRVSMRLSDRTMPSMAVHE